MNTFNGISLQNMCEQLRNNGPDSISMNADLEWIRIPLKAIYEKYGVDQAIVHLRRFVGTFRIREKLIETEELFELEKKETARLREENNRLREAISDK